MTFYKPSYYIEIALINDYALLFVRPGKKIGLLHVVIGLEDRGKVQLKFSPRRHVSEQVCFTDN